MSTHNFGNFMESWQIIFQLSSYILIWRNKQFHKKISLSVPPYIAHIVNEPRSEKTGLQGFRPGPIQTGLGSHRRW